MLFRFSLYGFLKNQRYYDPFLILVFLEKGLSFFLIGLLIGFREVCVNLFEVPSGALADLYGRRRSMIVSFSAYLVSFAVFAYSRSLPSLFLAMFFFACGEAFRSGTHKAMIFDWLAARGRSHEKAKVYGFTRSWSQIGSAVSVLVAALIVVFEGSYSRVFLYSLVPYAIGLANFFGYPAYLDGNTNQPRSLRRVGEHLMTTFRQCWQQRPLRRLLGESMLQRGTYETVKGYLQPALQQAALALPVALALDAKGRAAVLVGAVYFVLYSLSAVATRQAHRLSDRLGGPSPFTWWVFVITAVTYLVLVPAFLADWQVLAILGFVVLAMLQNLWKPVFLARVDDNSEATLGATVLSIDGQSKALFVAPVAPLVGWLADLFGLVSVAGFGLAAALAILAVVGTPRREPA